MKKITFLLMMLVALCAHATSPSVQNAVSMVDYEQRWSDNEGTLTLKNNISETIKNVQFRLTYFDEDGNQLDYSDFDCPTDIAPGMTRQLDVEAFNHDRQYNYYKSDGFGSSGKSFDVKFEVLGYNQPDESRYDDEDGSYREPHYGSMAILGLFLLLFLGGIYIGLYVLVAIMAKKRKRNVALWVIISLFATPLLTIIILLFVGDAEPINYGQNPNLQ